LEYLLEHESLVIISHRPSRNKVSKPQRVEGRELFDVKSLFEPELPSVKVLLVVHASHSLIEFKVSLTYLRVVLKSSKRDHAAFSIEYGY